MFWHVHTRRSQLNPAEDCLRAGTTGGASGDGGWGGESARGSGLLCLRRDALLSALDEKPKRVGDRALRRVRNIEGRPQVALVMDRYAEDWSRLGYVLVRGRATLLEPSDPAHAPALRLLRERYQQYRAMALEGHAVIAILPERVVSWGSLGDVGSDPGVLRDEGVHIP